MGTNVYGVIKDVKEPYSKIEELAKKHDLEGIIEYIEQYKDEVECSRIHIGKRSGGWKFLFNAHNWMYYDHTKESIMKFLRSCKRIENEYGEILTPEEFWEEYVESSKNGLTGKTYCKEELQRAKDKSSGKLHDPYNLIMPVDKATQHYYDGLKNDWWELRCDKNGNVLPENLDYRFSRSTDFS